jgi:hypothetical protein
MKLRSIAIGEDIVLFQCDLEGHIVDDFPQRHILTYKRQGKQIMELDQVLMSVRKRMKVVKNSSEGCDIYHKDIMCVKDFIYVGIVHTKQ